MEPIVISEAMDESARRICAEHERFVAEAKNYLAGRSIPDTDKEFMLLHMQWQAGLRILAGLPAPVAETLADRAEAALSLYATDIELSPDAMAKFNAQFPELSESVNPPRIVEPVVANDVVCFDKD
jgi:hypothetical protein